MKSDKEIVSELLFFIEAEAKKVSTEYGLPLYDRELDLLIYKVIEFMEKQVGDNT